MKLKSIQFAIVGMLLAGGVLADTNLANASLANASNDAQTPNELKRTPWGTPDLQGVWDFSSLTPFERPAEFAEKAVLTPEEAKEFVGRGHAILGDDRPEDPEMDLFGAYNEFWLDLGSDMDEGRTSLIIDPPTGRLPELTPAAQELIQRAQMERSSPVREVATMVGSDYMFAGPESLGLSDRCLQSPNAGPPISPGPYNNNLRIIQTQDHVVLFTEMIHDARIVPTDGRPRLPDGLGQWMGSSRGHWEDDTLVVETTNITDKKNAFEIPGTTPSIGTGSDLHLVERFTRLDDQRLNYEYTVTAPLSFTRPFTVRMTMKSTEAKIFEYACHEGNYSLENIIRGSRVKESEVRGEESVGVP